MALPAETFCIPFEQDEESGWRIVLAVMGIGFNGTWIIRDLLNYTTNTSLPTQFFGHLAFGFFFAYSSDMLVYHPKEQSMKSLFILKHSPFRPRWERGKL